jgi:hypothetical protein
MLFYFTTNLQAGNTVQSLPTVKKIQLYYFELTCMTQDNFRQGRPMSTEQERSFIARIRCEQAQLGFIRGWLSGQEPNLLTITNDNVDLIGYFRCYDDYYNIQIRSKACLGNFISKNSNANLAACPPAGGNTTSYNLLDANQRLITLDNIQGDKAFVYLKTRNSSIVTLQESPAYDWFSCGSGEAVQFELNILERNVPYPTSDEPYS